MYIPLSHGCLLYAVLKPFLIQMFYGIHRIQMSPEIEQVFWVVSKCYVLQSVRYTSPGGVSGCQLG